MLKLTSGVVAAVLALLAAGAAEAGTTLDGEYLLGTWAVADSACNDGNGESLVSLPTGAFESVDDGKVGAAGFWRIGDGLVDLRLISPPTLLHDDVVPDQKEYFRVHTTIVPFQQDS